MDEDSMTISLANDWTKIYWDNGPQGDWHSEFTFWIVPSWTHSPDMRAYGVTRSEHGSSSLPYNWIVVNTT